MFTCRVCLDLVYASQSESELARAFRRKRRSEAFLRGQLAVKPKGMHWRTFSKLKARIIEDSMRADELLDTRMLQEVLVQSDQGTA